MIRQFLKAKHWQIFLLIFGIPFIMQIIVISNQVAHFPRAINNHHDEFFNTVKFVPIIMGIYIFSFFGWMYSMAIGLQRKLPTELKMNINRFKIFFYIPVVYLAFIVVVMFMIFGRYSLGIHVTPSRIAGTIVFVLPIHLFSVFCMFYILYFVSKTVKTLDLKREVTFSDYAGEFFLLWFYFIGVWIIQPKVNKMADEQMVEPPISARDE